VEALRKLRLAFANRRTAAGTSTLKLDTAGASGDRVVKVENVGFAYADGAPVVKGLTTDILRGERIGVIGENGTGKTTLLKLLTGHLTPSEGSVTLGTRVEMAFFDQLHAQLDPDATVKEVVAKDRDVVTVGGVTKHVFAYLSDFLFTPERARTPVRALSTGERAKRVGYLPQELPCPRVTVRELVAFGRSPYLPLVGKLTDEDAAAVETALRLVALEGMADRLVDSLSGGERQKAFLAMVLAQETPLVVLDEPTAQLDVAARLAFCDLLKQLNVTTGKVFLVVMHELPEALCLADRLAVLQDGSLTFTGTPQEALTQSVPQSCFGITLTGDPINGYAIKPQ
jgi:ABC-type cobalamin/Fe3+-siderophores transport system ATPase subunit